MSSKCIILAILLVAIKGQLLIYSQQQSLIPCFFQFGDSNFDNGNNNDLTTLAKANYQPYGIDFFYGSIGRFTNGFTIPDFLSEWLGFAPRVPPSTAGGGTSAVLRGLDYASGGAGILDETASQVGERITMNEQIRNHRDTVDQVVDRLGNRTTANQLLRRCLYPISIGNSDYILNYYALPITLTRIQYTPEAFAERLIQEYSQQLTALYLLQARKVVVFAVFPLGCTPQVLSLFPTNGSLCVESINNAVQLFNTKLLSLINTLNTNLEGARFTFIDSYNILSGNFANILGIRVPNAPCCQINILTGLCAQEGNVCNNRNEFTYFDNFHITQIVANYTASRAFIAQSPADARPHDIRTLVSL